MAEYHDSYMDVSFTVCYIMAAIFNFKMADKLTYIQIRPYKKKSCLKSLASQTYA